jgi:hypothetical protein
MPKRKPEVRLRSYGIYTKWNRSSKELPKLVEATTRVRAEVDVEFGYVVNIKGAKNKQLEYCIDHPGIRDEHGSIRAPFDGTVYVKTNDWNFFLGDTIWEPISDKLGNWRMTLELDDSVIADKTFELFLDGDDGPSSTS